MSEVNQNTSEQSVDDVSYLLDENYEQNIIGEPSTNELKKLKDNKSKVVKRGILDAEPSKAIPDKMFFRIGDVADITGMKSYVLRFWEKEFDCLGPVKNNSGQRIYRKSDVESVLLIKRLLYKERYSIEGAKKRIKELRKNGELKKAKKLRSELDEEKLNTLRELRREVFELSQFCSQ